MMATLLPIKGCLTKRVLTNPRSLTLPRSQLLISKPFQMIAARLVFHMMKGPRRQKGDYLVSRSAKQQQKYFTSSDEDDSDEGLVPICDWANEGRCFPGLVPIKCQFSGGCSKFVHHLCANEWANANDVDVPRIATLCREHHPVYQISLRKIPLITPSPIGKQGLEIILLHQMLVIRLRNICHERTMSTMI